MSSKTSSIIIIKAHKLFNVLKSKAFHQLQVLNPRIIQGNKLNNLVSATMTLITKTSKPKHHQIAINNILNQNVKVFSSISNLRNIHLISYGDQSHILAYVFGYRYKAPPIPPRDPKNKYHCPKIYDYLSFQAAPHKSVHQESFASIKSYQSRHGPQQQNHVSVISSQKWNKNMKKL